MTDSRAPSSAEKHDDYKKPVGEHLIELRRRLLWAFAAMGLGTIICFMFVEHIYGFLVRPLAEAMGDDEGRRLIYTGLTEAFFTYLKVAFFAGIFLTFPVLAIQIWKFIAPGLYKHEKRIAVPLLISSIILFYAGMAFAYFVVFPIMFGFFGAFGLDWISKQTTIAGPPSGPDKPVDVDTKIEVPTVTTVTTRAADEGEADVRG